MSPLIAGIESKFVEPTAENKTPIIFFITVRDFPRKNRSCLICCIYTVTVAAKKRKICIFLPIIVPDNGFIFKNFKGKNLFDVTFF